MCEVEEAKKEVDSLRGDVKWLEGEQRKHRETAVTLKGTNSTITVELDRAIKERDRTRI